jgi:hypothetical protein
MKTIFILIPFLCSNILHAQSVQEDPPEPPVDEIINKWNIGFHAGANTPLKDYAAQQYFLTAPSEELHAEAARGMHLDIGATRMLNAYVGVVGQVGSDWNSMDATDYSYTTNYTYNKPYTLGLNQFLLGLYLTHKPVGSRVHFHVTMLGGLVTENIKVSYQTNLGGTPYTPYYSYFSQTPGFGFGFGGYAGAGVMFTLGENICLDLTFGDTFANLRFMHGTETNTSSQQSGQTGQWSTAVSSAATKEMKMDISIPQLCLGLIFKI